MDADHMEAAPSRPRDRPRVACLVLASHAPAVLAVTSRVLVSAAWRMFVHLDRKSDGSAYREALGEAAAGCEFVPDPVEVFWGGFSMIRAMLKLLETARERGEFDRFVLISDDSIPVRTPESLAELFDPAVEYIDLIRQEPGTEFYERYREFFFLDHAVSSVRTRKPRLFSPIDDAFLQKIGELQDLKRAGKKALDIYWGSQFWALTRSSIERVLMTIKSDSHLLKSFEFSAIPDELLIQSVVGGFRSSILVEPSPMYVDWDISPGPRVFRDVEDFPYDLMPYHAFIRKIEPSEGLFLRNLSRWIASSPSIYRFGQTAPGVEPGEPEESWAVREIYLFAPDGGHVIGWHGIELAGQVRFRWTATRSLEWKISQSPQRRGKFRVVLPLFMSMSREFCEGCRFRFGDKTVQAVRRGRAIFADFYAEQGGDLHIELHTPNLISPHQSLSGNISTSGIAF